tara:strand:+ start:73 stop:210 length:138 start_codon:yes stop_codon:yes gene_type:complete
MSLRSEANEKLTSKQAERISKPVAKDARARKVRATKFKKFSKRLL